MQPLPHIGFIGCGHMATSLMGGLIESAFPADHLHMTDIHPEKRERLSKQYHVKVYNDASSLMQNVDCLVLAVKPQNMKALMMGIKDHIAQNSGLLLISIAAGIQTAHLNRWLDTQAAIVRAMPNTPALLKSGATGLFANTFVTDRQKNLAESILRAVGITVWLPYEELMDAVTAVSGSGPAYFFYLMETMIQAGIQMGLPEDMAKLLTLQTAMGAAKMALESDLSPQALREKVCSKGGATEAAIAVMQAQQFSSLIANTLQASQKRSIEMGTLLGI